MAADLNIASLKRQLLNDVGILFHRKAVWKEPILEVLDRLRSSNVRAVFSAGTLRSLLVSRVFREKVRPPRDVDVVIAGVPLSDLEERFSELLNRRTRFGGLQLQRGAWQFDVWPVARHGLSSKATLRLPPLHNCRQRRRSISKR